MDRPVRQLYHPGMNIHSRRLRVFATGLMLLLLCLQTMSAPIPTTLPDCPDKPNCVSSQAGDPAHAIEPFTYTGSARDAMRRLKSALSAEKRLTVVEERDAYLHAEARSLVFRFVDDVEFLLDTAHKLIHVRSAARTGYSDLGVNRRRVERIRRAFTQAP
jgi:uncharacterized protein (DUF1499 family)